jgi:hypothetical protein
MFSNNSLKTYSDGQAVELSTEGKLLFFIKNGSLRLASKSNDAYSFFNLIAEATIFLLFSATTR